MKVIRISALVGMVMTALLLAAGCSDADKQAIKTLTDENLALKGQLAKFKEDADNSESKINDLNSELAAKQQELDAARKGVKVEIPTTKTAAEGWERGLIGDRVTVGTDILFAPGEAKLVDAGKRALDKIAGELKTTYGGMPIRVYGYTDNDPIMKTKKLWADNLDLSANRSMAVVRYLWSKGISKDRIEEVGMGDTHFVADNKSKPNKAKNRRVEIIVIKK